MTSKVTADPTKVRLCRRVPAAPTSSCFSDEGYVRAYAVGSRVRRGPWTSALEALAHAQGRGRLEERCMDARIRRTSLWRFDSLVWGYLIARGLVESFHDYQGDGIQLTEKGERAHRAGEEERKRLLERRHDAGVDHG